MVSVFGGTGGVFGTQRFDLTSSPAQSIPLQSSTLPAPVFGTHLDQFTPLPLPVTTTNQVVAPPAQSLSLTQNAFTGSTSSGSNVLQMVLVLLAAILKSKGGAAKPAVNGGKSETAGGANDHKTGTKLPAQTTKAGNGSTLIADGKGWDDNVSVFTSSKADEESFGAFSNNKLVGGYVAEMTKAMKAGKTITEAHDSIKLDSQTPVRNKNAKLNSLVPGKGGKAIVVTGDGISDEETREFSETLKKTYGMDVEVIHDASPKELEAAMKKAGQAGGSQTMVAILAHGAKDGSGKNNGNMALGKGDGDQWLSEEKLQGLVHQYLSPSFDNVNVMINSCFGGNYVQ